MLCSECELHKNAISAIDEMHLAWEKCFVMLPEAKDSILSDSQVDSGLNGKTIGSLSRAIFSMKYSEEA